MQLKACMIVAREDRADHRCVNEFADVAIGGALGKGSTIDRTAGFKDLREGQWSASCSERVNHEATRPAVAHTSSTQPPSHSDMEVINRRRVVVASRHPASLGRNLSAGNL